MGPRVKVGVVGLGGLVLVVGTAAVALPRVVETRFNGVTRRSGPAPGGRALATHHRLMIADLHADALLWGRDLLLRSHRGHVDLPRLVEGNVALQVFSVVTKAPAGPTYARTGRGIDGITALAVTRGWPPRTWSSLLGRALYQAERFHDLVTRSDGRLVPVTSTADLERFVARRRAEPKIVAGLLALEGMHALEGKVENLDVLHRAGFRMMGLVHLHDNDLAGSLNGAGKGGLTELGRRTISRMEELGIVLDLAHASPRAIEDALAITSRPVVVSHTGVQGTCNEGRNLSDADVRRIAERGGVIGIGYFRAAVCGQTPQAIARAVRYAVDLAGIDHVGLGSDFDGAVRTPFDVAGLPALTEALLEEGFSEAEIRKIAGENVLRLLGETLP